MIIAKATKREVKKFDAAEWHNVSIEHYGKNVDFKFKATEHGEIVGTISGQHESGVLYIFDLIIAKNKRNLGIGSKLMEKAELE